MKNTKTMLILCVMMLALSSCSNKNSESASNNTSSSTDIAATDITTANPTEEPTATPTKRPKKESTTSLKEYLNDYTDSKTYYLLYDVALNKNANTTMDENVTYMFPKDDNGDRIIGGVFAYYSDFKKINANDVEDFLLEYISIYFPELNDLMENAKTLKEDGYTAKTIEFDDYSIVIMTDDDMSSITFMISDTED